MSAKNEKLRLRVYLTIFFLVMILGTVGFMVAEDLSLPDAIYFTIVTIATVGYGDISPATPMGKILDVVLIVTGVGTFVGVVANATEVFLNRRESQARREKLNMVIGLFFSEFGGRLLRFFTEADPKLAVSAAELVVKDEWREADYARVKGRMAGFPLDIETARVDFHGLRRFMNDNGNLLVRLLESPYMLEHEAFTDLLIAALHLKEELELRGDFLSHPASDLDHLRGDIRRVYRLLTEQWLEYMQHLQVSYPFLFSLAVRTNPFDPDASPIVRQ